MKGNKGIKKLMEVCNLGPLEQRTINKKTKWIWCNFQMNTKMTFKEETEDVITMKSCCSKVKKNERRNERRTRICVYKPILFLNQSLLQRKERKRDQELKGKKVIFCEERLTSKCWSNIRCRKAEIKERITKRYERERIKIEKLLILGYTTSGDPWKIGTK